MRWSTRTTAALPALVFLVAALLAGGYFESTYSLLAAAVWLGIAICAALGLGRRPSGAFWALAALGAWTALSALWGPAGPALRALPLVVLYAGVLLAAEWAGGRRELWAAIVLVCAVALVGYRGGRLDWPVTYANGLGLVAVSGALLSLERGRRLGLPICLAAGVLTFSRSALLAGLLGLLVLRATQGRISRRVALAGAAVALVVALVVAQPLAARFAAPAPDEGDARRLLDVSGHGRTELWRSAWEQGLDAPLLGNGAATWARGYLDETGDPSAPANAHSLPLETFAELGLVGVALLVAAIALLLPRAPALVAAWTLAAAIDWTWQLPAATLPALIAAGAATVPPRPRIGGLPLALAALALGVGAGLHGLGAALLEAGERPTLAARLLPFDARPYVLLGDERRACATDPGDPSIGGCP